MSFQTNGIGHSPFLFCANILSAFFLFPIVFCELSFQLHMIKSMLSQGFI